jgi:hypothetical protein
MTPGIRVSTNGSTRSVRHADREVSMVPRAPDGTVEGGPVVEPDSFSGRPLIQVGVVEVGGPGRKRPLDSIDVGVDFRRRRSVRSDAYRVQEECRVEVSRGAGVRWPHGNRSSQLAKLDRQQWGSRSFPRRGDEGVDPRGPQVGHQQPVPPAGGRPGRIQVQGRQLLHRDLPDGVQGRSETSQRRDTRGELGRLSLVHDLHGRERLSAQGGRQLRQRRELQQPPARHGAIRHTCGPAMPCVQHLAGPLHGEEQRAGDHGGDRVKLKLDGCDDPEGAATAAQRPEQVGFVIVIDTVKTALRGDDLETDHIVDSKAATP